MRVRVLLSAALTLSLLSASPALAQKPAPTGGPSVSSSVQSYPSIQAFQAEQPSGDFRSSAVSVSRSRLEFMPMGALGKQAVQTLHLDGPIRFQRAGNGTVRWMEGKIGRAPAGVGKQAAAYAEAAQAALLPHAATLGLKDPARELRALGTRFDELGQAHVRFEQVYQGIPVWGRDVFVHLNTSGDIYLFNGSYEPTPAGISLQASLSGEQAVQAVVADLQAKGRWAGITAETAEALRLRATESRQVLYPIGESVRLAYEVTLAANLIEGYTYIVDAQNGAVLNTISLHCALDHEAEAPVLGGDVLEAAMAPAASFNAADFFDATATDLNGAQQALRVWKNPTNNEYYAVWDLPNFDAGRSSLPGNLFGGAITLDLRNSDAANEMQLFYVRSTDNTWADASVVSAHANMQRAYHYYKTTHGRNAIDGLDQTITSIVNVADGGEGMDNAFWSAPYMFYGNGKTKFKPLAGALDVSGHEMTHGVVEHTAGLIYQFQPGALNESFADVFGVMIDPEDYLLGEDIMKDGTPALRDLMNPDNGALGFQQPAHMDQYWNLPEDQDNGGVHVNSGIPNRAAALIIEAIGHVKTEQIYYRALSTYMTRNSQFVDARNALEQAAKDLHGEGSAELVAVQTAFASVGIGTEGGQNPDGNDVPPVEGGTSMIAVIALDGRIALLDATDPANVTGAFVQDAFALAVDEGPLSQLSTPADGKSIWFVDSDGYLSYIDLANYPQVEVLFFPNLGLDGAVGNLKSASVAPGTRLDGEMLVALVSQKAKDPNLYLFNGEQIGAVPLKPETSQSGIGAETIQYIDVVAWSPNVQHPAIAFDANNVVPVGDGGQAEFWSMFELNTESGKVYSLIPAQAHDISIGNITYSNTDPDIVAFNVFKTVEERAIADVMIGNFETGEILELGLPFVDLGDGIQMNEALRPTFSPDDDRVAFTVPSLGALMILDGESGSLTINALELQLYNPRWFALGGQVGTGSEGEGAQPAAVALRPNVPNPFSRSTVVRYELAAASDVQLDVYDLLGRRVAVLENGRVPAGSHEARFDAESLPSGVYVVRLTAGGAVKTLKVTLAH